MIAASCKTDNMNQEVLNQEVLQQILMFLIMETFVHHLVSVFIVFVCKALYLYSKNLQLGLTLETL